MVPVAILDRYLAFCVVGAGEADQLRGDLGARAERADPDVAAGELLGHDAHRRLAHAETTPGLGYGQTEDAELGERFDQPERDQLIAPMPAVGMGHDLLFGKASELLAHQRKGVVVEGPVAELALLDQAARRALHRRGGAFGDQPPDGGIGGEGVDRRGRQMQLVQTRDLALAHRDPARDPGQVLAESDPQDQRFTFSEPAAAVQPGRPILHLTERFDVGGQPGEAMDRVLLALERAEIDVARGRDLPRAPPRSRGPARIAAALKTAAVAAAAWIHAPAFGQSPRS